MHLPRRALLVLFPLLSGCSADQPAAPPPPAVAPPPQHQTPPPYILHLPGVAGPLRFDHNMIAGLASANLPLAEIYDWTCNDPGLHALVSYDRNQEQAQIVADKLTAFHHAHPDTPIMITSHSGGTGIAVWAIEKLPPDVHVDTVLLMASALSPTYDLSEALSHVSGHMYNVYSEYDSIVLGTGTRTAGTIDRVVGDAAGLVGFTPPAHPAVPNQYDKLVAMPYQDSYLTYGNHGDHIGPMAKNFAAQILSPLLGGSPPKFPPRPSTTRLSN